MKRARTVEVLTFVAVVLVSPASAVFGLPFGIAPGDWFNTWQRYVFFFIIIAMAIAFLGFGLSTEYRVKAGKPGPKPS